MKDILLKRNDLMVKSKTLKVIKFEPDLSYEQIAKLISEQNAIYNRWQFYDRFIKARREAKNEKNKSN